jgi:hypothetical protein
MAAKLHESPATVRNRVRIVGALNAEVRAAAHTLPDVANSYSALDILAKLPDDETRLKALAWLREHPDQTMHAAANAAQNGFAFCSACSQSVDTTSWPGGYGQMMVWHCPACNAHQREDQRNSDQVCGHCGARRIPLPPVPDPSDPDPAPDPSDQHNIWASPSKAADPNEPYAQQATQTSQAWTPPTISMGAALQSLGAPPPGSPSAKEEEAQERAERALKELNRAAQHLLDLKAGLVGQQIREGNDRPLIEHAKRTAQQLLAWVGEFDDAL